MEKINEWDTVNEQVQRSKIKRLPWKFILGESLTAVIKTNKMKGYNSDTTYNFILNNTKLQSYIANNPFWKDQILNNLWISVCARYGESNTEDKLRRDLK